MIAFKFCACRNCLFQKLCPTTRIIKTKLKSIKGKSIRVSIFNFQYQHPFLRVSIQTSTWLNSELLICGPNLRQRSSNLQFVLNLWLTCSYEHSGNICPSQYFGILIAVTLKNTNQILKKIKEEKINKFKQEKYYYNIGEEKEEEEEKK